MKNKKKFPLFGKHSYLSFVTFLLDLSISPIPILLLNIMYSITLKNSHISNIFFADPTENKKLEKIIK